MTRATGLVILLLAAPACIPEEGPMMKPGADCLDCHDGDEARRWTFAGTLAEHAQRQVVVVDATGKTFSVRINQVGNLWSSEPVTFPLRVSVDGQAMPDAVTAADASCNRCHGGEGGGED